VFHIVARVPETPIHLRPAAELADRVLLPGDPHRALHVAQALLEKPAMFNHHRGLWGYTGAARDGSPLTVQATGMGGPSAAIVAEELIALGARTLIRIGTCGVLVDDIELGTLLPIYSALAADGASRALGAGERVAADAELSDALARSGALRGLVASADVHDPVHALAWAQAGVLAGDLATAAVLAAARRHGAAAGALLAITRACGEWLADDALEPLEAALGTAGLSALSARRAG
jgi:uridine phosphorylase